MKKLNNVLQEKIKSMKRSEMLFAICIVVLISCTKTESQNHYIINGNIENYNGKIYLTHAVDTAYYFNTFRKDNATVIDGKFKFRLSKRNNIPLPFYLQTDKLRTSMFILEDQDQHIVIDSLYHNVKPKIICKNSTIPDEDLIFEKRRRPLLEEFRLEFNKMKNAEFPKDSIETFAIATRKKLTDKTNLILTEFTKNYPNSYVGFWQLVLSQMYNGYNEENEKAYNNLSEKIKQTKVARIFEEKMLLSKVLLIGRYFPELKLKNREMEKLIFKPIVNPQTNYILVDFWFSYCSPCIAQFPKLKELYKKYNTNELKIISISTDITKNLDNWNKVIEKNNILWDNYLDENGVEVSPLGINSYPTNYLLNNKGIILHKNISLADLEKLLN